MAIKITQPFNLESNAPNFIKDVINSATDYASGNPLIITSDEGETLSKLYALGHIVWDNTTKQHYVFNSTVYNGQTYYCWSKPTVSNQQINLNNVDSLQERLTLKDSIVVNLDTQNITYIPINGQPSDWNTNWDSYYINLNNTFVLNTNDTYNNNEIYYLKTII